MVDIIIFHRAIFCKLKYKIVLETTQNIIKMKITQTNTSCLEYKSYKVTIILVITPVNKSIFLDHIFNKHVNDLNIHILN